MKIQKKKKKNKNSLPIIIVYRFVRFKNYAIGYYSTLVSGPSRHWTAKDSYCRFSHKNPSRMIISIVVSFTSRLKAFQKLKEISPEKCDWLRLFHPIQQRSVRSLHLLPLFLSLSLSPPVSPSRATADGKTGTGLIHPS